MYRDANLVLQFHILMQISSKNCFEKHFSSNSFKPKVKVKFYLFSHQDIENDLLITESSESFVKADFAKVKQNEVYLIYHKIYCGNAKLIKLINS